MAAKTRGEAKGGSRRRDTRAKNQLQGMGPKTGKAPPREGGGKDQKAGEVKRARPANGTGEGTVGGNRKGIPKK